MLGMARSPGFPGASACTWSVGTEAVAHHSGEDAASERDQRLQRSPSHAGSMSEQPRKLVLIVHCATSNAPEIQKRAPAEVDPRHAYPTSAGEDHNPLHFYDTHSCSQRARNSYRDQQPGEDGQQSRSG